MLTPTTFTTFAVYFKFMENGIIFEYVASRFGSKARTIIASYCFSVADEFRTNREVLALK